MTLKKFVLGSFVITLAVYSATTVAANKTNSLDDAIRGATTSGQFRFGYIANDPDVAGSTSTSAAAISGQIKLETKEWKRLTFAVAPYFVEKIQFLSGDEDQGKLNSDFFDDNNGSYAYLGEAYVNYTWSNGSFRWGRQKLDTPFINTDDIRMLPHTYEAAWLKFNPIDNLHLEGGVAKKWAGFASGGNPGDFKQVGNDGALALGATYQMKAHHTFQGWYYDFDGNYSQIYADAIYNNGRFEAGIQHSDYSEKNASGTDGTAWGLMAAYDFGVVKASAAYNETSNDAGKSVSVGLCGCGSFFTSMDETNIADKTDASAYMANVEYPATEALTLSLAYGHFEDANKATTDIDEMNFILTYNISQSMDAEFIYTDVDNGALPVDADTNFSRQLLRINYNF